MTSTTDDGVRKTTVLLAGADATHEWQPFMDGLLACKLCGIVRRRDGKNKPCRGRVRVALRAEAADA